MEQQKRIGIIGGGLAGIFAARQLLAEGYAVEVIEKSQSVGGRMATRRINQGTADHGAVFFTVRTDELAQEVDEWLEKGWIRKWFGDDFPRYIAVNGMNQLVQSIANGIPVYLNEQVEQIISDEPGLQTISSEQTRTYDAILVTAPVPQAYDLFKASPLTLVETDHARLEKVTFEPTFVGLFELQEAFDIGEFGLLDEGLVSGMLKIVNNAQKEVSTTPLLSVYMTGDWSEAWYDKGEDKTLTEIEQLLQKQLGPVKIISKQLKRWRYAQARDVFHTPYLKLDRHPVWLAGDAFLDPQDTSGRTRVESAVISGLRVAAALDTHFKQLTNV
ncbi:MULTISPECIES: NAD(P)/FAD-dependent oxidoreductase [Exiguobacterium]|uniref:NAD(P)/FAD-dependent oxidoreductase n=1 Tax=Exiguobacterium TaxID=33986 RepID=UPI000479BC0E|nr:MULTISPECIES: FAD-dependent oxidoreductase [Exiguobacterium]MCT4780615.1 FAD-dependent oxidoreductase [Exiguobacterium soli]